MTYHYKYWSAFSEADLLNAGDHDFGHGDTFVMPAASTVTLASYDNDGQLSGDYYGQASDSDGYYDQYGWANTGSGWVRTGDLYVQKTFTLQGSDGRTYILAEIEGEGTTTDYFSFVGSTPPAGVSLTVVGSSNSHGVNYSDLSADPSQAPANTGPVFDNLPANGVIHLDENNTLVIDIDASDVDGDTLTYAITGGADAANFTIDPATGKLSFTQAPDYENPTDASGHDNVYDVTVTVTDGKGGSATKPLWVKIQDKPESGSIEGRFFNDENRNNREDDTDAGVAGQTVWLCDPNGEAVHKITTTDANGNYSFTDVAPGDYIVIFRIQNGAEFVDANVGDNVDDSDIVRISDYGNYRTETIWVGAGDHVDNVDGGITFTPENNAPVFDNLPANGVIHLDENNAHVIDIDASDADGDTLTYSISGGADGALFVIDPVTGDLCFRTDPDFENPHDVSGGNNVYDVTITVTDGNGGSATKALWIKIQDVDEHVNTAPVFDNLPVNGVICVDENSTFVIDVDASDIDGDNLTYAITGGADAGDFTINAQTGELTFNVAPDFENPHDASGHNNVYDVTVTVSDGKGGEFTKPLWIKVKDVDESTGPVCITIEAEHMNKYNFFSVGGSQASNDCLVKLGYGQSGDLSTTFQGETGSYDLKVFAQDENDGQSTIMVKVNGNVVGTIILDNDSDGGGSNNGTFSEFVLEDIQIGQGDVVQLWAQTNGAEYVRIDKIELCQDGEVCDAKLDFEGLNSGTIVNNQFDGVTITAQREGDGANSANDAMIFDSNNPTGGDHDLEYTGRGNILIISEDGDSNDADDNYNGGTITFDFDNPSDLKNIVLLDIEEAGGTIVLTKADGSTQTIAIPASGNNSAQTITLNATDVVSMDINLVGSGAVDDLCWTPGEAPVLGSLGGTYFMDNNDNSVEDAGDMAIANATVWLLQNGAVIASTTTDANGDYLFEGLEAGDYAVRFDEQDGKSFVEGNVGGDDTIDSDVVNVGGAGNGNTDTVTVGAGEDVRNVDGGVETTDTGDAQISGRITFDADDDDTENAAGGGFDEGFGGKTVELLDENGDVIDSTTTGADGSYSFTGLDAGTYSVNFPDTMGLTIADKDVGAEAEDSDANQNGQTDPIVVAIGDNIPNIDLSLQDPADASLGGRIFMDSDNDSQDNNNGDEAPAPGVTVRLLDADGNELDTTVTDANGEYLFENLEAGDYKVDFPTEVDGKVLVDQNVGSDLSDSDASQATGETGVVSVGISENVRDVDAGVEDPGTAAINGRLFMDSDDDSQDNDEMGVAGVEVELLDENGDVIDTTTTNGNGDYSFTGLGAGDYSVRFPEEVDGKVLVEQNVGPDATDSDADQTTGETGTISLEIGDVSNDNDAGIEDPAGSAIEGVVFMDNNDNSQNDAGDMPVTGVPVDLLNEDGDVIDSTVTGADGSYSFTGLEAGTYSVDFPTEVDGKVLVDANVGNDTSDSDATQPNGTTGEIVLGINETSSNNDAGIEDPGTASIGNLVFLDNNGNGVFDAGDATVAGVVVELLDENGDVIDDTTTNGSGEYLFDNLDAGVYSVRFTAPDGQEFTTQSGDAADATNDDSDADLVTGETDQVTLSIGEAERDVDAGLIVTDTGDAAIEGRVFMDNNDNNQDDNEMGVAGVEVTLLDENDDVVTTTTTGADGSYSFGGLDAGTYSVTFPTTTDDGKILVDSNVGPDETDSDADQGTGNTGPITVGIGETSSDNDAGVEDPGTASLAGRLFEDTDDDNQDNGEVGVPGVEVELLNEDGDAIDTAVTDANGDYEFTNLDAGTYSVRFPTEVDGKVLVDSNVGPDATDSDADRTTGETPQVTLAIGERSEDNDAGIEDPGTAAIGDKVFLDTNGNGRQDDGEEGVSGVGVIVRDANGNVAGTATTDGNGDYLVGGLDAGAYTVEFEEVDGFDFTTANAMGVDDAEDSDADETTGVSAPVTVGIGETNRTVDAGLVAENTDPEAMDDEAAVCATETVSINVLGNDADADGDIPAIAHVNGEELAAGESTTLDSGAVVTLNDDGTLSYDSSNAVINGQAVSEIVLGDVASDNFTYSITDGNGGTDTAEVSVTLKGGLNTIDTILSSAPTSGTASFSGFSIGDAYTAVLSGTGDARYDGLTIASAYCLERDADYLSGVDVTVDISGALDSLQNPDDFVSDVVGNLDLINWIINQDFTSQDNGDGTGTNYTDAEIQSAIWGITDDDPTIFEFPTNGTQANVQEILDAANDNGEGFVPGAGQFFTLVLNPTEVQAGIDEADDFDQAFIVALSFDDYLEECIC